MPLMSPPAQKAGPAPVTTTARIAGPRAARSSASSSSPRMASSMALRTAGRFSVSTPMPSSTLSRMAAVDGGSIGDMVDPDDRGWDGRSVLLQMGVAHHLAPAVLLGFD